MALPLVSAGNLHPSVFGVRSYTEGLAGRYVDGPFFFLVNLAPDNFGICPH